MEKRTFGSTGMDVSVLGFGGAEIGYQGVDFATVDALLNGALDAGLNVIDTAECYAAGSVSSEDLIGRAIGHRRDAFHLFTKCGHASGFELPDWDPRMLEQSIDRSLQRLKTDRLDLIQLHSCSADLLRKGDVIAALQRAREAGKVRFLGYSGDNENARYAVECGAFDALQTSASIADQATVDTVLPLAQQRGMGVIVKRPIANAVWRHETRPENSYVVTYWERLQQLGYAFTRSPAGEATGVALRFTLALPGVHTAIVGTTRPGRWKENADLLAAGPLPPDQFNAIRARWHEIQQPDWIGQT